MPEKKYVIGEEEVSKIMQAVIKADRISKDCDELVVLLDCLNIDIRDGQDIIRKRIKASNENDGNGQESKATAE